MAFIIQNGVAIPTDFRTLGEFQGMQRAIDSFLVQRGGATEDSDFIQTVIPVDGRIGPATLSAARFVVITAGASVSGGDDVFNRLDSFTRNVSTLADNARDFAVLFTALFGDFPNFTPNPADVPPADRDRLPPGPVPPELVTDAGGKNVGLTLAISGLLLAGLYWWSQTEA